MCFSRWNLNMWQECVFLSYSIEYETDMCFALLDSNMWQSCVVWITHVFLSVGFYYMPCRWVLSRMDCRVWDRHVFRSVWFYYPTIRSALCFLTWTVGYETYMCFSLWDFIVTIICSMNQTCVSLCVIIMCIVCVFFHWDCGVWNTHVASLWYW